MITDYTTYKTTEKYKKGDYILINPGCIKNNCTVNFCTVVNFYKNYAVIKEITSNRFGKLYDIDYIDKNDCILINYESDYILESCIIRKLTAEEIEEFIIKKEAGKYNI